MPWECNLYYGNQNLGDEDDSNIVFFDSDEYADNGDEDTTMGSPTGERDV